MKSWRRLCIFFWDSFILLRERNRRIQISEGPHALPWLYYKTPRGKIRWRWQDLSWGPRRGAIKTLTAVAQAIEPLHALFDKTTTLPAGGKVMTVGRAAWDGLILITSKPLPFIFFSSLSLYLPHTSCRFTHKHHRLPGIIVLAIILPPVLQASMLVQGTFPEGHGDQS